MDDANEIVWFVRRASVQDAEEAVDLKISADWSQLQAVAQEVAARTRNMFISNASIWCIKCASPLIAVWSDVFNDRIPCRAAELCISASCPLISRIDFHHTFPSFFGSKLGVVCYEISVPERSSSEEEAGEFDVLWPAWDRSTAQVAAFELESADLWSYFVEKLLREPEHGNRHYTLEGSHSSDELEVVENYMQVS